MKLPRKLKKRLKKQGIRELYNCYSLLWDDFLKSYKFPKNMQGWDETSEDYRKRVLEFMIESENDVAEIKSNGLGNILIRLNDKIQDVNLTIKGGIE